MVKGHHCLLLLTMMTITTMSDVHTHTDGMAATCHASSVTMMEQWVHEDVCRGAEMLLDQCVA